MYVLILFLIFWFAVYELIWFEIWIQKLLLLYETLIICSDMFDSFPFLDCWYFWWNRGQNQCEKWVNEGGTYLIWEKGWKHIDGGMHRKWKIKRVAKRVCQMDQLSYQFIGLEYQVRNGKNLSKSEIIGKKHQLIIKRTFLFKP